MMRNSDLYHSQAETPVERLLLPFRLFVKEETSAGILLLSATVLALIWANSPWAETYTHLWEIHCSVSLGKFILTEPLLLWINDGLMAMFFFVVGLEIKREVLAGELSTPKNAALPIAAAAGGMIMPALVFFVFNHELPAAKGWGVPMATDIAFALGVLVLLGDRVPASLKIFLTALAIADDLGAVLVIAFFYTSQIHWPELATGAVFLGILILGNRLGVRSALFYGLFGIGGVWLSFLLSGIHPTIAGVLAAMTIPARTRIDPEEFLAKSRKAIEAFGSGDPGEQILLGQKRQAALLDLKVAYEHSTTPLLRLEEILHSWIVVVVLPLFALANAGVSIEGDFGTALKHPVTIGIVMGLVVGKQLGITLFSWIAVRIGVAQLPTGVTWKQIYGVGWLGGIGFTMSLFITGLAYESPDLISASKVGVLLASIIAGIGGTLILRSTQKVKTNRT